MTSANDRNGGQSILLDGRTIASRDREIRLKWHKVRRLASDFPFDRENIVQALATGACSEIDIRCSAGSGFVLLHDKELRRETTGRGLVSETSEATLRHLRYCHPTSGKPGEKLLLFLEFAAMLNNGETPLHSAAAVQLDLKDPEGQLTDDALTVFADSVSSHASRLVVSGFSWQAVRTLADAAPGTGKGFDPLYIALEHRPLSRKDFGKFVSAVRATAADAKIIYLHHIIVARAAAAGAALVTDFQREGVEVDCWTLDPGLPLFEERLELAVSSGVDQITTNAPFEIQRFWKNRNARSRGKAQSIPP